LVRSNFFFAISSSSPGFGIQNILNWQNSLVSVSEGEVIRPVAPRIAWSPRPESNR
jgi:hypothetical protein